MRFSNSKSALFACDGQYVDGAKVNGGRIQHRFPQHTAAEHDYSYMGTLLNFDTEGAEFRVWEKVLRKAERVRNSLIGMKGCTTHIQRSSAATACINGTVRFHAFNSLPTEAQLKHLDSYAAEAIMGKTSHYVKPYKVLHSVAYGGFGTIAPSTIITGTHQFLATKHFADEDSVQQELRDIDLRRFKLPSDPVMCLPRAIPRQTWRLNGLRELLAHHTTTTTTRMTSNDAVSWPLRGNVYLPRIPELVPDQIATLGDLSPWTDFGKLHTAGDLCQLCSMPDTSESRSSMQKILDAVPNAIKTLTSSVCIPACVSDPPHFKRNYPQYEQRSIKRSYFDRATSLTAKVGWVISLVEARTASVLDPVFRTETGRWMKSLKNRQLLEFQVMYLTKMLKLRYRLHHIPPYPPKTCRLCNAADETFEHVFEDCTTAAARYQAWMDNDAKCVPRIKELEVWKGLLGSWIGNVGSYSIERLREAATKALQHRLAIWIELCKTKASIPGTPPLAPAPPHPSAPSATSTPVTTTPSGRVIPLVVSLPHRRVTSIPHSAPLSTPSRSTPVVAIRSSYPLRTVPVEQSFARPVPPEPQRTLSMQEFMAKYPKMFLDDTPSSSDKPLLQQTLLRLRHLSVLDYHSCSIWPSTQTSVMTLQHRRLRFHQWSILHRHGWIPRHLR